MKGKETQTKKSNKKKQKPFACPPPPKKKRRNSARETMPRTAAKTSAKRAEPKKPSAKRSKPSKTSARAKQAGAAKKAKAAAKIHGVVKRKAARVHRRHVTTTATTPSPRAKATTKASAIAPAVTAAAKEKSASKVRFPAPLVVDGVTGNTLRQRQWARRAGLEKRVEELHTAAGCSALLVTVTPGGQQRSGRVHIVGSGVLDHTATTLLSSVVSQFVTDKTQEAAFTVALKKVTVGEFMTALAKHEDRAATG